MNKLSSLSRKHRIGQTISEFAIFGSLLLVALTALVRYGMAYNYQQRAKMDAFKLALLKAYDNDTSAVTIIKDADMPNPQDMFGGGERQPIAVPTAAIQWSNGTSTAMSIEEQVKRSRSIEFVFNGDRYWKEEGNKFTEAPTGEKKGVNKVYTLAAVRDWAVGNNSSAGQGVYVRLPGKEPVKVPLRGLRVAMDENKNKALAVLVYCNRDSIPDSCHIVEDPDMYFSICHTEYCTTAVLKTVDLDFDGVEEEIVDVEGNVGETPGVIKVISPTEGDINPSKTSVSQTVSVDQVQGLINGNISIERDSSIEVTQSIDGGKVTEDKYNDRATYTHPIRKNNGQVDNLEFIFEKKGTQAWTNAK